MWAASSQITTPSVQRPAGAQPEHHRPQEDARGRNYRDVHIEVVGWPRSWGQRPGEQDQLIDMCIMIGTDFNPGIRGIGPKKGLKLIKENGTLERALQAAGQSIPDSDVIREIFLHGERLDDYSLDWKDPQRDKVVSFMCDEHGFSEQRINSALDRLERKRPAKKARACQRPSQSGPLGLLIRSAR